jgi:DNA oxidative demethylase
MSAQLNFGYEQGGSNVPLGPGAVVLRGFALPCQERLAVELAGVLAAAPPRQMVTRGGFRMSVAMTSCGAYGWVTDRRGYRYVSHDPESGRPWPSMPRSFVALARSAAEHAGFDRFDPDSCLVNRYAPGARMSLHRDADERDFDQPIVSVSLGLAAVFLFGGDDRRDRPQRVPLEHGDVVVWGGPARLRHHGVAPLADGHHARLGRQRINLTFRRAR